MNASPSSAFKRHSKAVVATINLIAALGFVEISAQFDIASRMGNLQWLEQNDGHMAGDPYFCASNKTSEMIAQFSHDELRLIAGTYGNWIKDGADDVTRAVNAAVKASVRTGVSVEFILSSMQLESSLGVMRGNNTTSAQGNLQSVEDTWIELFYRGVNKDPYYGDVYSALRGQITEGQEKEVNGRIVSGGYTFKSETMRKRVLGLRLSDPDLEAYLIAKQIAREYPELVKTPKSGLAVWRQMTEATEGMTDGILRNLPVSMQPIFDSSFDKEALVYRRHLFGSAGEARLHPFWIWDYYLGSADKVMSASTVNSNPYIFYKDPINKKDPRTIAEVVDFVNTRVAKSREVIWGYTASVWASAGAMYKVCADARLETRAPPLPRRDPRAKPA